MTQSGVLASPQARCGGVDDLDVADVDGEGVDDHADEREEVDHQRCRPERKLTGKGAMKS